IVAGIDNFQVGDLVPVAKPGAVLPGGFKIKKSKLRGVTSSGMLCSAQELGLDMIHNYGILVLEGDYPVGMDIVKVLGLDDWVLELGLTPNRSDCLGLLGVAYEVSAVTGAALKIDVPLISTSKENIQDMAAVKIIDDDLCFRYTARIVKNITVKPSPLWLQTRLLAVGIRPINNIVDVTNYVMWECNQPLHGFDYDRIKDQSIIVRKAQAGEKLVTLDEQERKLDETMLVIADPSGPVALAGVMGGLSTEITEQTRTVLIESACFEPTSIRRTSRNLGLRSESSLRFERGTDLNGTVRAADRAAQLMAELSSGQVVGGIIDECPRPAVNSVVQLRPDRARKIIGLDISDAKIKEIMNHLHFDIQESEGLLEIKIPTRRPDITGEIDLIEEIARIYGYEYIETSLPRGVITQGRKTREQKLEDMAKKLLTSCGLYEAITYSFIHPRQYDDLLLDKNDPLREVVKIYNPLSEEQSVMRSTLIGNLFNVIKYNHNRNLYD
ncbi:MAG: phenylalanine--tRNA ligase subunit beta, partial [Candidatus Contubernalis sp.]|nr:phenylalanine--tRNA ligase subunit beta [Candidatus Contubernalis sp.]